MGDTNLKDWVDISHITISLHRKSAWIKKLLHKCEATKLLYLSIQALILNKYDGYLIQFQNFA